MELKLLDNMVHDNITWGEVPERSLSNLYISLRSLNEDNHHGPLATSILFHAALSMNIRPHTVAS